MRAPCSGEGRGRGLSPQSSHLALRGEGHVHGTPVSGVSSLGGPICPAPAQWLWGDRAPPGASPGVCPRRERTRLRAATARCPVPGARVLGRLGRRGPIPPPARPHGHVTRAPAQLGGCTRRATGQGGGGSTSRDSHAVTWSCSVSGGSTESVHLQGQGPHGRWSTLPPRQPTLNPHPGHSVPPAQQTCPSHVPWPRRVLVLVCL